MVDLLEQSTTTVMAILISVILICSALIPITMDQITALTKDYGVDVEQYTDILQIVVIICIIGLIIGVVRAYTKSSHEDVD